MKFAGCISTFLFILAMGFINTSCTSCAPTEADLEAGNIIIEQEGVSPVNE